MEFDLIRTAEKMLVFEEGRRLVTYRCTKGFLTVGVGHNLDSDPAMHILKRKMKLGSTITVLECIQLFNLDFDKVFQLLDGNIKDWKSFKLKYQLILISMVFQMGMGTTLKFKNTIKMMRTDNHLGVKDGIKNSAWYKQTPKRCERLMMVAQGVLPKEY